MAQQQHYGYDDDESVQTAMTEAMCDRSWFGDEEDEEERLQELRVFRVIDRRLYSSLPCTNKPWKPCFPKRSDVYLSDSSDDEDDNNEDDCQNFDIPMNPLKDCGEEECHIVNLIVIEDAANPSAIADDTSTSSSDMDEGDCSFELDSIDSRSCLGLSDDVMMKDGFDSEDVDRAYWKRLEEIKDKYYKYDPIGRESLSSEDWTDLIDIDDEFWARAFDSSGGLWVVHSLPFDELETWVLAKDEEYQFTLRLEMDKAWWLRPYASKRSLVGSAETSIEIQIDRIKNHVRTNTISNLTVYRNAFGLSYVNTLEY